VSDINTLKHLILHKKSVLVLKKVLFTSLVRDEVTHTAGATTVLPNSASYPHSEIISPIAYTYVASKSK